MTTPSHISRAINRFKRAVENHAFIGTIPRYESDEAEKAASALETELEHSEAHLRRMIDRYAKRNQR